MEIYQVGGSIRDEILNIPPQDLDYVVVGSTIDEMLQNGFEQIGTDFPVFLHPVTHDEYALARMETKCGDKHTDFKFKFTPDITLEDDLKRRDFTINAIAKSASGKYIDPFNGIADIQNKCIRHIDSVHFMEDPLRILRGCRFIAQLNFTIHPDTLQLFKLMVESDMLNHLTAERIWKETYKALQSPYFYKYLENLDKCGALEVLFPEIHILKHTKENPLYHPEGNTYKHLILCLQNLSMIDFKTNLDIDLINFGILCHDLGKGKTPLQLQPKHHDHCDSGIQVIRDMCNRLKVPNKYKHFGELCCLYHMKFHKIQDMNLRKQYDMVKYISDNFKSSQLLYDFILVCTCDYFGRDMNIDVTKSSDCAICTEMCWDIFHIMDGVTLKHLDEKVQIHLSKFTGSKFGEQYRCALIDYLRQRLSKDEEKQVV